MIKSKFFGAQDIGDVIKRTPKGDIDWGEIDNNGSILHLTSGEDADGKDYYAYMFVQPSKYQLFLENSEQEVSMNLHDYGLVIECGFGVLPPADIQKKMEEEFFFNHIYEDKIIKNMLNGAL